MQPFGRVTAHPEVGMPSRQSFGPPRINQLSRSRLDSICWALIVQVGQASWPVFLICLRFSKNPFISSTHSAASTPSTISTR
jgi:hypothetical protein